MFVDLIWAPHFLIDLNTGCEQIPTTQRQVAINVNALFIWQESSGQVLLFGGGRCVMLQLRPALLVADKLERDGLGARANVLECIV